MPRFIVLLPLTTLFFVLSLAAISIGHQQPPSTWAQILHLNDCELPCWIGILPGQTTLMEAQRQLERVFAVTMGYRLKTDDFRFHTASKNTGEQLYIAFNTDEEHVTQDSVLTQISLRAVIPSTAYELPSIGELSNDLGVSDSVRLANGGDENWIAVLYTHQYVRVFLDQSKCGKVSTLQEIHHVWIVATVPSPDEYWLSDPQQWRGFGRCYDFERKSSP